MILKNVKILRHLYINLIIVTMKKLNIINFEFFIYVKKLILYF